MTPSSFINQEKPNGVQMKSQGPIQRISQTPSTPSVNVFNCQQAKSGPSAVRWFKLKFIKRIINQRRHKSDKSKMKRARHLIRADH